MKITKEYIILTVIIVALAAYLVFHKTNGTNYCLPSLKSIPENEITKVIIKKGKRSVIIEREDERWIIMPEKYPADEGKVRSILRALSSISITALVSKGDGDYRFDLDPDHRINVRAMKGDKLLRNIYIGKVAPSYRHTFVRIDEKDMVYHAKGNLRSIFDKDLEDLRDKNVMAFNVKEIKEISIEKKKKNRVIKLVSSGGKDKKSEWKDSKGKKIDKRKVKDLLDTLSTLECISYVNNKEKKDFSKPIYRITLKGPKEYTLSIFKDIKKDSGFYIGISSENRYPFRLSRYTAEKIMNGL